MPTVPQYRFGFDIGGTFTDFVLCDVSTGQLETYKTLTTPHAPAQAVIDGWRALLSRVGAGGDQVLDRLVEIALEEQRLGRRAAAADRAVQAAVVGLEAEQAGHEVAHVGLVVRGEAVTDEVLHRRAARGVGRDEVKAARYLRQGGVARGGVVEPR